MKNFTTEQLFTNYETLRETAPPYSAVARRYAAVELEILEHPTYSLDFAPRDFYVLIFAVVRTFESHKI